MAWADTKAVIRDVILLLLGCLILVHELVITDVERPLILGAGLSCLGLPLLSGMSR